MMPLRASISGLLRERMRSCRSRNRSKVVHRSMTSAAFPRFEHINPRPEEARVFKRAPSRRTATGEIVRAAILRDGHVQQAARDLLRMRSVACVVSIRSDWFMESIY